MSRFLIKPKKLSYNKNYIKLENTSLTAVLLISRVTLFITYLPMWKPKGSVRGRSHHKCYTQTN